MLSLDIIKAKIKNLYETNPNIHMSITLKRPRLIIENEPVKIVGVYPNIFQIEEYSLGEARQHTLQYTDIYIGQAVIPEIENL